MLLVGADARAAPGAAGVGQGLRPDGQEAAAGGRAARAGAGGPGLVPRRAGRALARLRPGCRRRGALDRASRWPTSTSCWRCPAPEGEGGGSKLRRGQQRDHQHRRPARRSGRRASSPRLFAIGTGSRCPASRSSASTTCCSRSARCCVWSRWSRFSPSCTSPKPGRRAKPLRFITGNIYNNLFNAILSPVRLLQLRRRPPVGGGSPPRGDRQHAMMKLAGQTAAAQAAEPGTEVSHLGRRQVA